MSCVLFAAEKDDGTEFATAIQPLFQEKCSSCHGAEARKGDLDLRTSASILRGGESGAVLVPGQPDASLLYQKVVSGEMPPKRKNSPLTQPEIDRLRRWIQGGALFGAEMTMASEPEVTQHDVIPILLLRCTVCHGAHKCEGELDLRTRASMVRGGKSGPALVPGQPEQSLLVQRVLAEEMPPRKLLVEAMVKPMEPDEVKTLSRWIELGAPEVASRTDFGASSSDTPISDDDRAFWSFQPPRATAPPPSPHPDLVRNPIDAFVSEKLSRRGLSFSPPADRLTLLRRAAYDLNGLPAEPELAQTFLHDPSPDAYEKLLDTLLASPRYGERWGRHWLDVAGYADCEGRREQHLPRPFAWRYRDYVIRSFNVDKPFDRFLQEQLAGDELAEYEHAPVITQELEDNLVATAFLRMAPDPTWANLTGFVPDRLEVVSDALDVMSSGVMGLTFKCARCHSHKFDPIPQRDYYRLAAVFKGAYDEHDWLKPEVNGYGGALSAGLGDRYLPYVTSVERKQWEQHEAKLRGELNALKSAPATAETTNRIKALEAQRWPEPRVMALWDRGDPSPTYVYRRGNYLTPGVPVEPGLPSVLVKAETTWAVAPPWLGARSTGRRLAFARWLTGPEQPLTARVMVNRIWKHHFGRGLVGTLGNFGRTGDRPTHPELLDWLAVEFIRQGWSVKAMHRLIMTSNTYRQGSAVTPRQQELDPSNLLCSRMPLRRMSAEELRDSLLWVAGQLDETRFGPAEPVTVRPDGLVLGGKRRSVYIQQLRKQPASLLESFDLPSMNPNCLERAESLVAPQALHLFNDSAIRKLANSFAQRVQATAGDDPASQIDQVYRLALGRAPRSEEHALCQQFLVACPLAVPAPGADNKPLSEDVLATPLARLCHTLMNSAAFLYID